MALDIKRISKAPFQRLERPQGFRQIPHVRRYFGRLAGRAFSALFLLAAGLTPLTFFDFGASAGAGRATVWFALAGLAVVLAALSAAVLARSITYRPRAVHAALAVLLGTAFVSALAGLEPARSLSFSALSAVPLVPALVVGVAVVFALANLAAEPRFLKLVLVSHFLGSTVAALAILARFFTGGYEGLLWAQSQSWLAVFSVNVFLLLSFAMLQKGAAKTVWTMAIVLHLAALFLFDKPVVWAVLLVGASALLVFQMLYAKKLWQRNFIYPLQIWVVSLLLLIAPVKMFTGISVPELPTFATAGKPVEIVRSLGWRAVFGAGAGNAERAVLTGGTASFFDLSERGLPVEGATPPPQSGLHLLIENGIAGLLAWLGLLVVFFAAGWRFLRGNLASIKEEAMSESVYLGVMTLVSAALLVVLLAFLPWAFPPFWLLALLLGTSLGFMDGDGVEGREDAAHARTLRFDAGRMRLIAPGIAIVMVALYLLSAAASVKTLAASRAALAAARSASPAEALALWQKAARHAPREARYRVLAASAEAAAITEFTPLDEQRDILERANAALAWAREHSRDPLAHWAAAEAYTSLESVAEGSLLLAAESLREAAELAPGNVPLTVAIARFYRTNTDALASSALSASALRAEARAQLGRALRLVPEYVPARLELALIIEQEQGIPAAIAELAPWEEVTPEIRYHIGRLHFNDGAFETAVEKFAEVLAVVPNHSNAHYSLGVAYYRLERYEDSLREFETVLEMNPGSADVRGKIEQVREKL